MITVCGASVSLKALHNIKPVTPANAGRRWRPIEHGLLVDAIKQDVEGRGWKILDEKYSTARDGADMAGALLLGGVGTIAMPQGITLALGFLHSNARRAALSITVGASVTCCTNGLCTGNIILNRVHDRTVSLDTEINMAINQYVANVQHIPALVAELRKSTLTPGKAADILLQAGRRRLVGWAAIGRVDAEYRKPTFQEHGTGTAWALLNAFTYAARRNIAPTRQMAAYKEFFDILVAA